MKKTLKKDINGIGLLLLLAIGLSACDDNFLDQETPHIIAPDNLFVDEAGFDAGLNGLYSLARIERAGLPSNGSPTGNSNNLTCAMMVAGTDVIYGNRPWNAELFLNDWGEQILGNADQEYFKGTWNWLYEIINDSNTIINRADQFSGKGIDESTLNRISAEAKTMSLGLC